MTPKYLSIFISACLALTSCALAGEKNASVPEYMRDQVSEVKNNDFEHGSILYLRESGQNVIYKGAQTPARTAQRQDHGLALPDGKGGIVMLPGGAVETQQDPNLIDARELKLKMRELASQLVTGLPSSLSAHIALPTAFVQQDDFDRSSSFGRFAAEQLYYEFNQRGLRTKEYRMSRTLTVREDGEFILSRNVASSPLAANTIYVVGTYYTDGQVMFLNARLLRANGDILRTGQLVLQVNPLTKRMLANSGRKMPQSGLDIKDFNTEARQPKAVTAFDQGLDIH